jgi:hypothetical protein
MGEAGNVCGTDDRSTLSRSGAAAPPCRRRAATRFSGAGFIVANEAIGFSARSTAGPERKLYGTSSSAKRPDRTELLLARRLTVGVRVELPTMIWELLFDSPLRTGRRQRNCNQADWTWHICTDPLLKGRELDFPGGVARRHLPPNQLLGSFLHQIASHVSQHPTTFGFTDKTPSGTQWRPETST